ncbi:hypothetical protein E4U53_002283 [Claviceps sorghi]|nr:hypothetical protein E4U53_002283 [Claviceps sorghi]
MSTESAVSTSVSSSCTLVERFLHQDVVVPNLGGYWHLPQRANLARIRDNQRRSRARRREYLQDLEQKVRACELQGIEATAEVQMAARRVADENVKLRELLHKHGATDDYIARYLQGNADDEGDSSHAQGRNVGATNEASASTALSLQQLMLPRRAAHLEPGAQFVLSSRPGREGEASIAGGSTIASCAWKCSPPTMATYSHPPRQLGVLPSTIGSSDHQQYSPSLFQAPSASAGSQQDLFRRPRSEHSAHVVNDAQQSLPTAQPIPIDDRSMIGYPFQMSSTLQPASHSLNTGPPPVHEVAATQPLQHPLLMLGWWDRERSMRGGRAEWPYDEAKTGDRRPCVTETGRPFLTTTMLLWRNAAVDMSKPVPTIITGQAAYRRFAKNKETWSVPEIQVKAHHMLHARQPGLWPENPQVRGQEADWQHVIGGAQ